MSALAAEAARLVEDRQTLGLGSGKAASEFIHALSKDIRRRGLNIRAIATSEATASLALSLAIPLTSFAEIDTIDLAFDGADEVDPHLDLIKGYGGALAREKIVATAARRFIVLVGSEKLVATLGARGRLPIEVLPFGLSFCTRALSRIGLLPTPRRGADGALYLTDNGNAILDCAITPIADPPALERQIGAIAGVVAQGLFLTMAETVLVAEGDHVRVLRR